MRVLPDNLGTEDGLIESRGALGIGGPDGVFKLFDVHGTGEVVGFRC